MDLAQALYGHEPVDGRQLVNLWKYLPQESAVNTVQDPGGAVYTRWTTTDHLLAFLSEQIDQLSYITVLANSDGKRKPRWKHVQHTRPQLPYELSRPTKKRRSATTREVKAILRGEI